jgi:hypothetical protein
MEAKLLICPHGFFFVLVYTILLGGNRGGAFSDLLSKSKTLERT